MSPSIFLPLTALSRRAFLGGALALGLSASLPFAHAAEAFGRVNALQGRARASSNGQSRELAVGAEIFVGDTIETESGSRLALETGGGGELKLGAATRVVAAIDTRRGIRLEQGAILVDAPEGRDVGLETPFAAISAGGARVFVGPSNDVTGVFVERGSVNVKNNAGEVVLTAGQGTDLTSADIAPTPAKAWGEPRIAAALASVT